MEQSPVDTVTWVKFAFHAFDSIWATAASTVGGLLAGWLLLNKPKFMQKVIPEPPGQ